MIKALKKEAFIVILSSFSITVYLLPLLYLSLTKSNIFKTADYHGIVSWVTLNHYPIQAHLYYYALTFLLAVVIALFFQGLWLGTSFMTARICRISRKPALRIDAYTYLFGIFGLIIFFIDKHVFFKALPFFIALIFISKIFAFAFYKKLTESKWLKVLSLASYTFVYNIVKTRKRISVGINKKARLSPIIYFFLLPIVFYFLLYNPGLHERIDLLHEGEHLDPCQKIMEGQKPYKDFYVLHGLLHDVFLPYLGVKIFGATLEGYRKFHSAMEAGLLAPVGYLAYYFLCLILFKRRFTACLAMLFLFCTVGFKDISGRHIFAILTVASIMSFIDNEKPAKLVAAGVLSAIALIYSIEFGITTVMAISVFLVFYRFLVNRKSPPYYACYLLSFLIGFAPFLFYLIKNGALGPYLQMTFRDSILLRPYIWGKPYVADHEIQYISIFIYAVFALWHLRNILCRYYTKTVLKSIAVLICGILYFIHALITPDSWHIKSVSFLAFISLLIPAESFLIYIKNIFIHNRKLLWQRYFIYNIVSLLCVVIISGWFIDKFSPKDMILDLAGKIRNAYTVPKDGVRLGLGRVGDMVMRDEKNSRKIEAIVKFIQQNTEEGSYIYAFGNIGLYYFLTERKNPTRYALTIYASSREMQEEVVRDLIKYKPDYIISEEDTVFETVKNTERFPVIWSYIKKNYYSVFKYDETSILKYKPCIE